MDLAFDNGQPSLIKERRGATFNSGSERRSFNHKIENDNKTVLRPLEIGPRKSLSLEIIDP